MRRKKYKVALTEQELVWKWVKKSGICGKGINWIKNENGDGVGDEN